jgi:MFS family permease
MNKRILVSIFLVDFLTGISAWYVFLNAVNFVNMFTEELIYYSFIYIFNPLFSSMASIVIGYFSDKGHLNRFIGLALFMMFLILLYQSFIKYNNLFLIYIILAIYNMAYTLYDVLKYSLVPKITTVFERINAVYELSYAILMVFGPLLSLFLMMATYIAPLLPLASLLIFFVMSKKVEYKPSRSTYSFLSASRKIFLNKSFRLVSLIYLILTSAGSLVNLAIIQVSQKFYLTEIFIANFALINTLIGLGSALASILIGVRRSALPRLALPGCLLLSLYPITIFLYLLTQLDVVQWGFLVISVFNGFSNSILTIYLATKIQNIFIDNTAMAFATLSIISNITSAVTLLIAGILSSYISFLMIFSSLILFMNMFLIIYLNNISVK